MTPVRCQRGVVAVEAALLIAMSLVLLPMLLYLGRLTMHAIVLDKAVYGAASIVAALPAETHAAAGAATTLRAFALDYIDQAAREAGLDTLPPPAMTNVLCDGFSCGGGRPGTVTVNTRTTFQNTNFDSSGDFGIELTDLQLSLAYTVSYVP